MIDDSDESLVRYIAEWNAEIKKMSAMPMFNPKLWTAGINKFAEWAKQIYSYTFDLKLEKDTINEYYTVVTIYPRRRANKNDTLILDTRPANISAEKSITTRRFFHCYGRARYLYHVFSHG